MKSFKIRIELNNEQTTLASKHAGIARYAYNWGLAKCNKTYAKKNEETPYKRPSSVDLHKMWVAEVKTSRLMKPQNVVLSKPLEI